MEMALYLALFSMLAVVHGSQVPQPHFPAKFKAEFVSDWLKTTGTYSLSPHSEKIVMEDSTGDHMCSSQYNHTKCIQLVTQGYRFHHFPEKDFCCKCCTYTRGNYECGGPLSPAMVNNATGNLQYLGVKHVHGEKCHHWNAHYLHDPNYYFEFVDSPGKPCEIHCMNYLRTPAQRSDNQYIFKKDSVLFDFDEEMEFRVPEICREADYCGNQVCATGPDSISFDFRQIEV